MLVENADSVSASATTVLGQTTTILKVQELTGNIFELPLGGVFSLLTFLLLKIFHVFSLWRFSFESTSCATLLCIRHLSVLVYSVMHHFSIIVSCCLPYLGFLLLQSSCSACVLHRFIIPSFLPICRDWSLCSQTGEVILSKSSAFQGLGSSREYVWGRTSIFD